MKEIFEKLILLSNEKNAEFMAKLAPTVDKSLFIGVKVPEIRKIAKEITKTELCEKFLNELPHKYYEENLLHSIILSECRDYGLCLAKVKEFLPFIDNWAVCDTLRPKVFAKHKNELLPTVNEWISSSSTYTCRFGVDMLMTYYLDKEFKPEYNELPAKVNNDEYYVKMMVAWYFATALSKQWDSTVPYLEKNILSVWIHNKTIQKARESFRITDEQKKYLNTLKR